jgi:hypothetical protein
MLSALLALVTVAVAFVTSQQSASVDPLVRHRS